jgi:hypothetical protein
MEDSPFASSPSDSYLFSGRQGLLSNWPGAPGPILGPGALRPFLRRKFYRRAGANLQHSGSIAIGQNLSHYLLYFFRMWSVSGVFSALILGLHFGMCIWASWAHLWFSFLVIYGLLGYCSAVVWGVDVSSRSSGTKAIAEQLFR